MSEYHCSRVTKRERERHNDSDLAIKSAQLPRLIRVQVTQSNNTAVLARYMNRAIRLAMYLSRR